MKIGLIMQDEKYWSLQRISKGIFNCLDKKHEIMSLYIEDNTIKNQKDLDAMYEKCDVVIYMASKLVTFKRKCNKPTLFFIHAWMDHGAGINFYINRDTFGRNDVLLFASSSAKKKFDQVYSTNMKSVVIPYFSANLKRELKRSERILLRNKYKIPEDSKILMYFGRFSPEKNIEVLFDMAKKISSENYIILLIGDFTQNSTFGFGEIDEKAYRGKIKEIAASDKSGKIILINRISDDDLNKLISIAFLTINPTLCLEENFSLSTIESFSAGIPVVASNWGGIKDLIRNKRDGFLMETFFSKDGNVQLDINAAVDYMEKLLSNIALRENLSQNASERYNKLFSEKAFLRNFNALLIKINKKATMKDEVLLRPKAKYALIYKKALRNSSVKTIYSDSPWLFRDLYKNYLGNKR